MDIAAVSKRIREAIMDRAADDGKVFHASAIEEEVAKILKGEFPTPNYYGYNVAMAVGIDGRTDYQRLMEARYKAQVTEVTLDHPEFFVRHDAQGRCDGVNLDAGGFNLVDPTEWR